MHPPRPSARPGHPGPQPPWRVLGRRHRQRAQGHGPYGAGQLSVSGFSEVCKSVGGGGGQIAIHGTINPGRIGGTVSSGCIRMLKRRLDPGVGHGLQRHPGVDPGLTGLARARQDVVAGLGP